jgi:DNA-3-methyladenine glycosylase I
MAEGVLRCRWAVEHPELVEYHDEVWGRPTRETREIMAAYGQCVLHAGLLWTAMLKKRSIFAAAFDDWDVSAIAAYDGAELDRLVHTPGVVRNFQKLNAVIHNAGRIVTLEAQVGLFGDWLWQFVDNAPLNGNTHEPEARRIAEKVSEALRQAGFKFAGPATAYGLMEDIGMVNDHDPACFRAVHQ